MMVRRQISIPEDIDNYLETKNASGYIVDLIRADMKNNKPITREYILQLIQEYMGGKNLTEADKIDHDVQESIGSFINL